MVEEARTQIIVPNVQIPNSLTHLQQFQELVYQLKALQVAAGGTMLMSNGGGVVTTKQTQIFTTPATPGASTLYRLVINGTNCDYTTDGTPTQAELRDNMILAIDAAVPGAVDASASGNNVLVTSNGFTAFTYSIAAAPASNPFTLGASVAAANADNINSRADVTTGTSGTGAWWVIEFADMGGVAHRQLWAVNDASSPFQVITHRGGNATWTGGSTSALPTVATGFAYSAHTLSEFHPVADAVTYTNLRYSTWRTASPDLVTWRMIIKQEGTASVHGIVEMISNSDADGGGTGAHRWAVFSMTASASLASVSTINLAGSWNTVNVSGSASVTATGVSALHVIAGSWTAGLDIANNEALQPMLIGQTATNGRLMGSWVDVFACPGAATFGLWADSTEGAQTFRRRNFGALTFYWPSATASIL